MTNSLMFVELKEADRQVLCNNDIHIQDLESKKHMLRLEEGEEGHRVATSILEKYRKNPQPLSNLLALKPNKLDKFVFRLINKRALDISKERSYIAISYRWKKPAAACISEADECLVPPISDAMFQAVLSERRSAEEGLWCDQICIDQQNEEEKLTSIGAMDMIYGHARTVVVALDDVTLDHGEASLIDDHTMLWDLLACCSFNTFKRLFQEKKDKFATFVSSYPEIHAVLRKVFSSECFERAWCSHEIRLARNLVFLTNCSKLSQSGEKRCVRMTLQGILALRHMVRMLGYKTLDDLSDNGRGIGTYLEWKSDLNNYELPSGVRRPVPTELLPLTTAQMQIWELRAGGNPGLSPDMRKLDANLDKLSIVLNASGLRLALTARSEEDIGQATELACFGLLCSLGFYVSQAYHTMGLLQSDYKEEGVTWIEFKHEFGKGGFFKG